MRTKVPLELLDKKAKGLAAKIKKGERYLTGWYWDLGEVLEKIRQAVPRGGYEAHCDRLAVPKHIRKLASAIYEAFKGRRGECLKLTVLQAYEQRTTSYHGKQPRSTGIDGSAGGYPTGEPVPAEVVTDGQHVIKFPVPAIPAIPANLKKIKVRKAPPKATASEMKHLAVFVRAREAAVTTYKVTVMDAVMNVFVQGDKGLAAATKEAVKGLTEAVGVQRAVELYVMWEEGSK